jgi:hypothetical protein
MPRRVRERGSIGRKASATLRWAYTLVLGLGGWFLAALIVMMTWPTLSLSNEPLGILSIGVPIGLGIYWAWVHRDRTPKTKRIGFAAATGSALVGAWLGFTSTTGLLALITTIVGASIGANLILLVLDISRERSARNRLALIGSGTSPSTLAARAGHRSMCSWRAGCGGTRTSGSEGGGEETTGRKAGIGASPPTLRLLPLS